jgi:soluble lytic murein transglycosylase-like protein
MSRVLGKVCLFTASAFVIGVVAPAMSSYPLPETQASIVFLPAPAERLEVQPVQQPVAQHDGPDKKEQAGTWDLPLEQRQKKAWPLVLHYCQRYDVDPALVMALVQVESLFRPQAVSRRRAAGLMQINRVTARHLGLSDPLEPEANLEAGIRYLASLKTAFDDDLPLTLAAYNAGPTMVRRLGKVPAIKETRHYVSRVLGEVDYFRTRFQSLAMN